MVIDVQLRLIVWESLPFSGDCLCLSENDHPDKHCDQIVENGGTCDNGNDHDFEDF